MITSYYIIHDCETGGLNALENPITEYAAIILDYNTLQEVDRFSTCVKPYDKLKITPQALNSTMLSMSQINAGLPVDKFVKTITQLYDKHRGKARDKRANRLVSVGHNVPFDHLFLAYALAREGHDIFDYFHDSFVDTMLLSKIAWGLEGVEKLKLGICCERAGITLTDAHGAMADVEATADLFRYFIQRMRMKGAITQNNRTERERGDDFFPFQCGAMK